jgi:CheY-like chemotaxis protein
MTALRKILVVDDDPVVGKSFTRVLGADKGYVVITSPNAAEALERMREQEYDLVVTDIKMPGMDGVELAEQVRARKPWTPVVIVTGYGTTDNEARAKAAGVSAFMRKPLTPEMIEESAAHALLEPAATTPVTPVPLSATEPAPVVAHSVLSRIRNIALFVAAPFIGLVYALMLPIVGGAMLAWMAGKAIAKNQNAVKGIKAVAWVLAAPFIGLAYAVLLPLVGTAMLLWVAGKALMATPQAQ